LIGKHFELFFLKLKADISKSHWKLGQWIAQACDYELYAEIRMETLKIILLCILAAAVYGILHDQVTARVCLEYFTIGHPPMFPTDSPTLLAFGWGVVATWWVGLFLGLPAAWLSRFGSLPKMDAARLIRPIVCLTLIMGFVSLLAGLVGYQKALSGEIALRGPLGQLIPKANHPFFLADLWAHSAAYAVGFVGGVVIWLWILIRRWQMGRKRVI